MFQETKELFDHPIRVVYARKAPQESDDEVLKKLLRKFFVLGSGIAAVINDRKIRHGQSSTVAAKFSVLRVPNRSRAIEPQTKRTRSRATLPLVLRFR